jgi:hypothetical protein
MAGSPSVTPIIRQPARSVSLFVFSPPFFGNIYYEAIRSRIFCTHLRLFVDKKHFPGLQCELALGLFVLLLFKDMSPCPLK